MFKIASAALSSNAGSDEILITGKYVLQEVYYDSSKTYVKSISYTHPSSSPTQTTTLEIYDKYGYLLSKEQNVVNLQDDILAQRSHGVLFQEK